MQAAALVGLGRQTAVDIPAQPLQPGARQSRESRPVDATGRGFSEDNPGQAPCAWCAHAECPGGAERHHYYCCLGSRG